MAHNPLAVHPLHILEVRTRGLVVEARLNDIPVFAERTGRGRLFQMKCEPYLITGENEIRLWLRLPGGSLVDEETRDPDKEGACYCRARVMRVPADAIGKEGVSSSAGEGEISEARPGEPSGAPAEATTSRSGIASGAPAPARELTGFVWDPGRDPLVPGRVFETGPLFFAAECPAGRWAWEQAPLFRPAGEDPAEIRVLVEKLWKAVWFRDVEAVVHLTREKTRDLARALGVNAGELEADQAQYLTSLFTAPGWDVAPWEPEAILLEPAARRRLVDVRTVDGEAPIRGSDGRRSFIIRPMVAKIEGRWRVVR